MTGTLYSSGDQVVQMLGLLVQAKRTEEAARRAFGESLAGPPGLIGPLHQAWQVAQNGVRVVHMAIRRLAPRNVIPMARRMR